MKYKTFVVVGGSGFVGSHLVESLIEIKADKIVIIDAGNRKNNSTTLNKNGVIRYQLNALSLKKLEAILEAEKPEAVFDLAVKPVLYSYDNPEYTFKVNTEIAHNLIRLLRQNKYDRLLHFSSSEAYGSAIKVPMSEEHPLAPYNVYGASKAAADLLLLSYHKQFNSNVSIIRPFNMYGERQRCDQYGAVIPLTINRILHGENPIIEGDGKQTRDLNYVKNTANAAIKLLECDEALGKVVNIGCGEITINSVISLICKKMDFPIEQIKRVPERKANVKRHFADYSLAKKLIDYYPKIDLDKGLDITINWYKNNV